MAIRLKQLAQDGATDKQPVVWDNASGLWKAGSEITLASVDTQELRLTPDATQSITAAANTIASANGVLRISADADYVMSSTPTLTAGADGEIVVLKNVGTFDIELQDDAVLTGSDIFLSGAHGTLAPAQTMTLQYSVALSGWNVISHPNPLGVGEVNVRNQSGSLIASCSPVYAVGFSVGQNRILIGLAEADVPTSMPAIGLTSANIANGSNGTVISDGALANCDTSAWAVGDSLYVDTTAGVLVNVRPTADAIQKIGIVVRSHASQGLILVAGAGRVNDNPWNMVASTLDTQQLRLTPDTTQSITAAANTIASANGVLRVSADADYVMSSTPTVATGSDGEILVLKNVGTFDIELQDDAVLSGSDVFLGGTTGTLAPAQTMMLQYSTALGGWNVVSHPNAVSTGSFSEALNVRNVSGALIAKCTPVYITGWNSGQNRLTIDEADADSMATMPAIGLTSAAIADGSNGTVIAGGELDNCDTSAWSVGDSLYVDTTAGVLVNVRPVADFIQKIGTVARVHATQGVILVSGASRINDNPWNMVASTLRTGAVAADTLLLQARDVDGASYATFATLTANNTPTMALSGDVTSVTQSPADGSTKLATTAYVDGAVFTRKKFRGGMLIQPTNADWPVNVKAGIRPDSNNAANLIYTFSTGTKEGLGFDLDVPVGAGSLEIGVSTRANTTPAGAVTSKWEAYERGEPDGADPDAWSSAIALDDSDHTTNEFYVDVFTVKTIAAWGLTTGISHKFEIVRNGTHVDDDLVGDAILRWISRRFLL